MEELINRPDVLESHIINPNPMQSPHLNSDEVPHLSPSGFHMAVSPNTYLINCAIVNPSEDTSIMMKTYMQLTGFINPISFSTSQAYQQATAYLDATESKPLDIALIDMTDVSQGINYLLKFLDHYPNALPILMAEESQLPKFSSRIKQFNALILLKPTKFSFVIDWIRSHLSIICNAQSKADCLLKKLDGISIICSKCKFD